MCVKKCWSGYNAVAIKRSTDVPEKTAEKDTLTRILTVTEPKSTKPVATKAIDEKIAAD